MKKFLVLILLLFTFFIVTEDTQAKVLPQSIKSTVKQTISAQTGTSIGVSARLRGDRRALIVSFSSLQNASAVSYSLRYKTNGQEEGAMGALNLTGSSTDTTELLFGTCSKNVCRYHTNITEAKLEVTYTNKAGKRYLKRFRIKV